MRVKGGKLSHDLGYKYGLLRWQNDVAGGLWRP
jgi:hypothetical protein